MKKLFNKVKEWIVNTRTTFRQIHTDEEEYKRFVELINTQANMKDSEMVRADLRLWNDKVSVCSVLNVPEEYAVYMNPNQEWMVYEKLNEMTMFSNALMRDTWGFGNYIPNPEFYRIEDALNGDDMSRLTFMAIWKFVPIVQNPSEFVASFYKKFFYGSCLFSAVLLGIGFLIFF